MTRPYLVNDGEDHSAKNGPTDLFSLSLSNVQARPYLQTCPPSLFEVQTLPYLVNDWEAPRAKDGHTDMPIISL